MTTARAEYDAGKGSHAFALDLRGRDNRSYADVSGSYPIVGPYREAGFILETDQGPRSACRAGTCDWNADHAVLIRGEPEQTTTFELRAPQTTVEALFELMAPLREKGDVYLSGTLIAPGSRAAPSAIEVAGDTVALNDAVPTALDAWKGRTLREIDLALQVRHAPGTEVPAPSTLVAASSEIHPLLRRWVVR
jgi:inner membrane protein